jgi:hypothetical protein
VNTPKGHTRKIKQSGGLSDYKLIGENTMKSIFEQNGGTYSTNGDYLIPDIILKDPSPDIVKRLGLYACLRQRHLKNHSAITYNQLLLSEWLYQHLQEVDELANERLRHRIPNEVILSELVYE